MTNQTTTFDDWGSLWDRIRDATAEECASAIERLQVLAAETGDTAYEGAIEFIRHIRASRRVTA